MRKVGDGGVLGTSTGTGTATANHNAQLLHERVLIFFFFACIILEWLSDVEALEWLVGIMAYTHDLSVWRGWSSQPQLS